MKSLTLNSLLCAGIYTGLSLATPNAVAADEADKKPKAVEQATVDSRRDVRRALLVPFPTPNVNIQRARNDLLARYGEGLELFIYLLDRHPLTSLPSLETEETMEQWKMRMDALMASIAGRAKTKKHWRIPSARKKTATDITLADVDLTRACIDLITEIGHEDVLWSFVYQGHPTTAPFMLTFPYYGLNSAQVIELQDVLRADILEAASTGAEPGWVKKPAKKAKADSPDKNPDKSSKRGKKSPESGVSDGKSDKKVEKPSKPAPPPGVSVAAPTGTTKKELPEVNWNDYGPIENFSSRWKEVEQVNVKAWLSQVLGMRKPNPQWSEIVMIHPLTKDAYTTTASMSADAEKALKRAATIKLQQWILSHLDEHPDWKKPKVEDPEADKKRRAKRKKKEKARQKRKATQKAKASERRMRA